MSDQTNDDFSNDESGSALRQQLERALKAEKEANERADLAERKSAFADVKGLDLTNKTHAFFATKYDGKADAEAIKAAAIEAGILQDEQAAAAQDAVDQETRFNNASQDAEAASVSTPDTEKLKSMMEAGNSREFYAQAKAAGILIN